MRTASGERREPMRTSSPLKGHRTHDLVSSFFALKPSKRSLAKPVVKPDKNHIASRPPPTGAEVRRERNNEMSPLQLATVYDLSYRKGSRNTVQVRMPTLRYPTTTKEPLSYSPPPDGSNLGARTIWSDDEKRLLTMVQIMTAAPRHTHNYSSCCIPLPHRCKREADI